MFGPESSTLFPPSGEGLGARRRKGPEGVGFSVKGWSFDGVLFELYRYPAGPASESTLHIHDQYQFCLSLDFPGEYRYRGAAYAVPVGALSIIHPGEIHASRDRNDRLAATTFRVLYAAPAVVDAAAGSIAGRVIDTPFFTEPIILDHEIAGRFLRFHMATEEPAVRLEQDVALLSLVADLLSRHAETRVVLPRLTREHAAVRVVREYLQAHHAENPSLAQLADVAGLGPFHLAHAFREEVGLPPHAYLIGVRITRAKELLASGLAVGRVAVATGFFDQSHFTRHFKRLVGVSPGQYVLPRKNVQAERRPGR